MSTATHPRFEHLRSDLHQIGHQLLETEDFAEPDPPPELVALEAFDTALKSHNQTFLDSCRALYKAVPDADLKSAAGLQLLADLKANLNKRLQTLDQTSVADGKGRRTYLTAQAGQLALEKEASLGQRDRLLHPNEAGWVNAIGLRPDLRPGLYALTFDYREKTVELAGAFVIVEKNTPVISTLTSTEAVGGVLLFTPRRGLDSFTSLADLNDRLRQSLDSPLGREEFADLLPRRYQSLATGAIWPLVLLPIEGEPVFEHAYDALLDKRSLDIDWALSLEDNPTHSARQLSADLERAITAAAPDLSARLELRAQVLLDRHLLLSAPDWYRSATVAERTSVAQHLGAYNRARTDLLESFGPAASPEALARYQVLEHLAEDLEINDLDPEHVQVSTRRTVAGVGDYEQQSSLVQLALRGLHTDDEVAGSDFLSHTRITYNGDTLPEEYSELTPGYLVQLLARLQPRLRFREVQQHIHSSPQLKQAIGRMLDLRINALAYVAMLQNHISKDDYQLIQDLRGGQTSNLSAVTLSFHGAQLNDLWLLRHIDDEGQTERILLCAPGAPNTQQFFGFNRAFDCQAFVLKWSEDDPVSATPTMGNYLVGRVALRFRPSMRKTLTGLSFKPLDKEHLKVVLGPSCTHAECLKSMTGHFLSTQLDDYLLASPTWYHSATDAQRTRLASLAEDIDGATRAHDALSFSAASFPTFKTYLKAQAKLSINRLLGRPANDVDPDDIRVHSPKALFERFTTPPMTYTQLYRDGYEDGIGFINNKFSTSATFTGPADIDLSALTPQIVARSVTGVWIGQRYADEVRAKLLSTSSLGYRNRRDATLAITQLQMLYGALGSQLQGHLASVDLDWLQSSIKGMGDSDTATRQRYPIHRLLVDGEWLMDLYVFSHEGKPSLLYTPNAPDNIAWREARLFNFLLKHTEGMLDYLVLKTAKASQPRIRQWLAQAREQLPQTLDKTTSSTPRYDSLEHIAPLTDLRQSLYNMKLQRKIDDVHATTVNRTKMITDILWTCIELVTAVVTAPFPILSLSTGLLLAFKDAMLALHAYNQGDHSEALQHLFSYLLNSAGGLLTDLRPALTAANIIKKAPRLLLRNTVNEQAARLIKQLEPESPTLAGMQPVMFEGQSLWTTRQPNSMGRYLLYRYDAASDQLLSTSRLVSPDNEGRWVRFAVPGGGRPYKKLPEELHPLARYEIPPGEWRDFEAVLDPRFAQQQRDLASYAAAGFEKAQLQNSAAALEPQRRMHFKQVEQLKADAQDFFSNRPVEPPRVDVLDFADTDTHAQILTKAFSEANGIILGEIAPSIASKQFLIQNMKQLADLGVKRLYIEFLPRDVFKLKLTKHNTVKLSKHIDKHLKLMDESLGFAKDAPYSYRALMREAREHGVNLHGLDASSSYDMDNLLSLGDNRTWVPQPNFVRNFYSSKVLEADIKAAPTERWVVLTDQQRVNTYNKVPGLADLQKTVSIRIEDIAIGQPAAIAKDLPGSIPGDLAAKADFKLTVPSSYRAAPQPGTSRTLQPPAVEPHFSQFDLDEQHLDPFRRVEGRQHGADSRYGAPIGSPEQRAQIAFVNNRVRLDGATRDFFTHYTSRVRAALPTLGPSGKLKDFLKAVYKRGNGLIIGETHAHQSSKRWLIEHLTDLKQQKVKTLYVEHLQTDLHQADLDLFNRTGRMPDNLKNFLISQNRGHMREYSGPDNYTNVLEAANKLGIRIRALDCSASYYLKGMEESKIARTRLFNFHAHKVIEADQAAQGPHKWVAFMGNSHTDTYMKIPGVAQLQDAVSLDIEDAAPGLGRELHTGYWRVKPKAIGEQLTYASRSDFKLDVSIAGQRAPSALDTSRIKHKGEFLIHQSSPSEIKLWHRSLDDQVKNTPIQIDDNGLFHIDRWTSIQNNRYESLEELIDDLINVVKLTPLEPY
ncbi:membrane-targeted effector domain-containing toxin [Pseudomonas sp. R5-89-07]|uniref:membrane-targeted effector domain-containing toxin n=1 Tax=Pseudomonas sp. R5-89-07 TaxID=658644 RepID=UPI000F58B6E3|nr:membrane-targeted effector domain-containing toxin [Pseudomonas sp. R5-89-07]AZF07312.1 hypothetical protein C4J94_4575 [Pseudomonas sp. R5-89-07]